MSPEHLKKLLGEIVIPESMINSLKKRVGSAKDFAALLNNYALEDITNLSEALLYGAIILDASDIHIEPEEECVRLRLRIDGILQDIAFFDNATYRHLISRIKLLSKIKLNIADKPQDGRFTVAIKEVLIEIRTSTLPSEHGESVVMRILNPANLRNLEALGLRKDVYDIFIKEIHRPNGMIIVTGPTGSGKTTSLYAFLLKIQNPEIKIITIEDPIEYHIKGISQTQVSSNKNYTFSEGLKSIVRQDPDVILVGEIRDAETAKIALQASLTGHLVLTTLHTNDAAGTIPRLVDLGTGTPSIASALKMIVAQRLVRKVCAECAVVVKADLEELRAIKSGLANIPSVVSLSKDLAKITIAHAKEGGCKACNGTGYKGRKGLYEVFLVNTQMEQFILTNPSVSKIKELAIKSGMVTMWQSGLIEVIGGETTLEEVKKVVEPD